MFGLASNKYTHTKLNIVNCKKKQEMVLPKWISDSLENSLKKYLNDEDIKILEFTSSPAIPVGENYTTDIFRTTVTYTTGTCTKKDVISLIIKCCPPNELLRNYDKLMGLFEREIDVYLEILPAINKTLKSNDQEPVAGRCIWFKKDPDSAIILEDLSALGFKMHPRQNGLDLQHCLVVVEKLANFHAASAVLYEQKPSRICDYKKGIFWDNPFSVGWISSGLEALIDVCAKWPGNSLGYEKYSAKLMALKKQGFERTLKASQPNLEDFNVLNHGDLWINNVMFSYKPNAELNNCRFIDFQVVLHSSPAVDLNYFWATSPNIDVRNRHLMTILDHYYDTLVTLLIKLQYSVTKIPTREQFLDDFKSRAFYGLAAAVTVLPFVAASTRDDASFDNFLNGNDPQSFRHHAYHNERYIRCLEYLLPFYDNLGVLD